MASLGVNSGSLFCAGDKALGMHVVVCIFGGSGAGFSLVLAHTSALYRVGSLRRVVVGLGRAHGF